MPPPLPQGFSAAGAACGIRKLGADLALFRSDRPAAAAALFTRNLFPAAPVVVSARHLASSHGRARAVLVNAGCANAATGRAGHAACGRTLSALARLSGFADDELLVASTGVIGELLPDRRITEALPALWEALSADGLDAASAAILTTDTVPKTATATFFWQGRTARITGCAKGAGMIHPRLLPSSRIATTTAAGGTSRERGSRGGKPGPLRDAPAGRSPRHATMLAFLFTDAGVAPPLLRRALALASARSFEAISVDGDTSTNDSVFLLANGASGLRVGSHNRSFGRFLEALSAVAGSLAEQIVRDGEGARRILVLEVTGAHDHATADLVAREICRSPLVKTALAGGDANWGRFLSAAGASGARFDPSRVELSLAGVAVARAGSAVPYDRARVASAFRAPEVRARLVLGRGPGRVVFRTCDLTEDYVRINADYRS